MKSTLMANPQSLQKLNPISLFVQLAGSHTSGRLQVTRGHMSWSIYLDQGQLAFATSSVMDFERFSQHLERMGQQIPLGLIRHLQEAMRGVFTQSIANPSLVSPDYQVIKWLVEHKYLNRRQVTVLTGSLAKEAITSFLAVTEGSYAVVDKDEIDGYPDLCRLDLRSVVAVCQEELRRQQGTAKASGVTDQPLASQSVASQPVASQPSVNRAAQAPAGQTDSEQVLSNQNSSNQAANNAAIENRLAANRLAAYQMVANQRAAKQQQPAVQKPLVQPQKVDGEPPVTIAKPITKNSHTIACIDDSPSILQTINAFLSESNCSVVMINDPLKALMQVIRTKPDLVLLDVGMPNLDGYELCSLMRRHSNFKNTPIIMVTGNTGFIDRARAKLVGASGYLTKPFTKAELLKMVFKHLT